MDMKYPHLFEPIVLGKTFFKNRIFSSPTGHHELTPDCFPDAEAIAYYEYRAKGGAASVCVGDCIVDARTGQSHTKQLHIDDPLILPSLTLLANAITRHGAVASAELSHGGKFSHVLEKVGGKVTSPPFLRDGSGITYGPMEDVSPSGTIIHEMPEEVILELIDAHARAAAFAKHCGFGMVTIHGGHGWLLTQFMSPTVNKRKDRWGGSFENRMRLTMAVIDAVRKAVGPRFPIEFRMTGDEVFKGGYDIGYGVEIAKQLDGKVDLIHVSTGNHEVPETFVVTHPNMFLPEGCNVKYAAEIKKHVKTPVATVGALTDPAYMEEVIASGQADVVQLARQLLVDPDFVNKVRSGREDDAHRCMRCETCFSYAFSNRCHRCAINPQLGTYVDAKFEIPAARKETVLVVGGGVGGMQAALTAAERGHKVILCEKSGRLGGVLNCERGVPFKDKLVAYLDRQARKVERAGIEVRLNTEVTPEYAAGLHPDAIVAAVGAVPVTPNIPGISGTNVKSAADVYADPACTGKNVVILGGGFVGLELAIHLGDLGRKVTVVEMLDALNDGGNTIHAIAVNTQLKRLGIRVVLSTKAIEINSSGLVGESSEGDTVAGRRLFEADTVVYAAGQRPLWETAGALRGCAPEFYVIGDCRTPRIIADATKEAYWAARDIGNF
jgi:2,4-dienoyl-CoA reductase-like NADH-dependent reductase (Old Yellow Enzyme family)/NADPH-dependent 2,4-dienoyl-CoA reductase/sulfur reductase-like enzyme